MLLNRFEMPQAAAQRRAMEMEALNGELVPLLDSFCAEHRAFGNSEYIIQQRERSQTRRLGILSHDIPACKDLLEGLEGRSDFVSRVLLRSVALRCAILNAQSHLTYGEALQAPETLSLSRCIRVLRAAANEIGISGSGKSDEAQALHRKGGLEDLRIWRKAEQPNAIEQATEYLVGQRTPLASPSEKDIESLRLGQSLLGELMPKLARSVFSHVDFFFLFEESDRARNVTSASQYRLSGAILLNRALIGDPWWVAEHILHEALHQKLYDFRHGHSLLCEQRLDEMNILVPSIWNGPGISGTRNLWAVHRTYAAFHVYVHLAILALLAERDLCSLEKRYGAKGNFISSRVALDRAHYLGEMLLTKCSGCIGVAGERLAEWCRRLLAIVDTDPPPSGAKYHLARSLYLKEASAVQASLASERSDNEKFVSREMREGLVDEIAEMGSIATAVGDGGGFAWNSRSAGLENFEEGEPDIVQLRHQIVSYLDSKAHSRYQLESEIDNPNNLDRRFVDAVMRFSSGLSCVIEAFPRSVAEARMNALRHGSSRSCSDQLGRMLAALAAAVPAEGRILEIGAGVGVGTSWICHGLGIRNDVEVISLEGESENIAIANAVHRPDFVKMVPVGPQCELAAFGQFDLILLNAGWNNDDMLEDAISLLAGKGSLLIGDARESRAGTVGIDENIGSMKRAASADRRLATVELDSGILFAVKRAGDSSAASIPLHVDRDSRSS